MRWIPAHRILDPKATMWRTAKPGELYSCNARRSTATGSCRKDGGSLCGDYCSVGDLARRDEDGFIHLVDRRGNMIISGGENVYPSEVENILGGHPAVKEVAVIGVADEKWGESVHAVVVPHDGAAVPGRAP